MSEDTVEAKRTRVAGDNDEKEETVVLEEQKQPAKESPPSWLTSNENSATTTVPSWQSTQSAPAWNTSSTTTTAAAATSKEVPSWLSGGSSFDKPSSSTSSNVPSWLSAGSHQTSSVFGSAAASSSSSTFGALSSSASVFGAKKEDAEDNEDSEGSGGEESGGENDASAAFGHGAEKEEDPNAAPPASVETGEENESVLIQLRVKLYRLTKNKDTDVAAWSDVGAGPLRLNTPNATGNKEDKLMPRLIMRRQGVWTLLLNAPITAEFVFQVVGDKMIRISCESFAGEEASGVQTFLIKCSRQDDRNELLHRIQSVVPKREAPATATVTDNDDNDDAKEDSKPKTGLVEVNDGETKE